MVIVVKSSRINISEENKTKFIAKVFVKNIKVGDVLFLIGELGVGKTTFIKFLINFF
jgi:Predicted ATPase or kinase